MLYSMYCTTEGKKMCIFKVISKKIWDFGVHLALTSQDEQNQGRAEKKTKEMK